MSEDGALNRSAPLINSTLVPIESVLYYYGNISRETAEWILWDRGCQDGMYLVRESSGDFVLSLCFNKSILHYRIKRLPGGDVGLCGVPHQLFPGPVELVEGVEGLACKPIIPCNKSLDAILPLTHWGLSQDEIKQAIIRKGQEWGLNEAELMLSMSEAQNDVKHLIIKTLHEIQPWFYGHLSREQAEKVLVESGMKDGKFLVRERNDSSYAFCLSHGGKIKHYKIDVLPSGEFAIQDGQRFPSIIALVSHYSLFSDGLWCALTEPCDNRSTGSSITQANLHNKHSHQNLPSSPNPESLLDIQTSSSSSSSSIHSISSSVIPNDIRAKNMEGRSSPSSPGGSLLNSPFWAGKSRSNTVVVSGNQKGIFTKLIHTVTSLESQESSSNTSPAKGSSNICNSSIGPVPENDRTNASQKTHFSASSNIPLTPQTRKASTSSLTHSIKDEDHHQDGPRRNSVCGNAKTMQKASSFDLIPAFLNALFSGSEIKDCGKNRKHAAEGSPESTNNTRSSSMDIKNLNRTRQHSKSEFYVSATTNDIASQQFEPSNTIYASSNLCKKDNFKLHYANKDILNATGRSLSLGETNLNPFDSSNTKESDSLMFIRSASSPSVVSQGMKSKHSTVQDQTGILESTSHSDSGAVLNAESNEKASVIKERIKQPTPPCHEKNSAILLSETADVGLSGTGTSSPINNSSLDISSGSTDNVKNSSVNESLGSEQDLMYFDLDEDESSSCVSAANKANLSPVSTQENDYLSDNFLQFKAKSITNEKNTLKFSESCDQLDIYATLTGDSNALEGTLKRPKVETLVDVDPPRETTKYECFNSFLSEEESELAYQTLRRHRRGPVSLDPSAITLNDKIGSGNFGEVWCGSFSSGSLEVLFAVKMLKSNAAHQKNEIMAEALTMAALDHPHIVRLIGVCDSDPFMLVMELAPLGPLNKYLRSHRDTSFDSILMLMVQVSNAMEFLESEQFVHRDLAARNVLLVNENFAKISDFGMSRALGFGKEYYRAETPGKWPLKWYAPECIYYFKFSTKSDVWSFGVTLWEAMSHGSKPYQGMTGGDILQMFDRNQRLPKPKFCPDDVYDIMHKCWQYNPEDRPDFSLLHQLLKQCAASYKCR